MGNRCAALAQVLAAAGLNQPVERVVGVVVARLDALVAEVDGLLRVVLDVGDVAGGVVGVVQVLHLLARPAGDGRLRVVAGEVGRLALGQKLSEAEGERVVAVAGAGAVLVVDALALALGVIVDVGDADRRRRYVVGVQQLRVRRRAPATGPPAPAGWLR
jgi:hypothetical protein